MSNTQSTKYYDFLIQQHQQQRLVPIKPKQYYMPAIPPVAPTHNLILPLIPKPLHARDHTHGIISSLSSGLPSLSHSMKVVPSHISTFPSLLGSTNPSGKVSPIGMSACSWHTSFCSLQCILRLDITTPYLLKFLHTFLL